MIVREYFKETQTTNGTTTTLWTSNLVGARPGTVAGIVIYIHANEPATGDQKIWAIHAMSEDENAAVSSTSIHTATGDAGAAAWSVEIVAGSAIDVDITGETSHTINWVMHATEYGGTT